MFLNHEIEKKYANKKFLTLEQNLCVARVFLNVFGLILDDKSDINEFSKIKIYSDNKEIGNVCFENGKVIIKANSDFGLLEANYDISQINGFIDTESNNALFAEWRANVKFNITCSDSSKIMGDFLFDCTMDSQFGIKCMVHPIIKYQKDNSNYIKIQIQRDGSLLILEIKKNDIIEEIRISPFDNLNGYLVHRIDKMGKQYQFGFENIRQTGIFGGGNNSKTKLHVFSSIEDNNERKEYINYFVDKEGNNGSTALKIQKGMLMQKLDPIMYQIIKKTRDLLATNSVSLLDNLIAISMESYTDEEIKALIGLDRIPMQYQNNGNSLSESYYGIDDGNPFKLSNKQQKLLRK